MTDACTLKELYRHMEWADAAVWTAVLASEGGRTDAKLRDNFYHLHMVQRAFLRTWRNELRETPYPTFGDPDALMQWGRTFYGEAWGFLGTVSENTLSQPNPVPWAEMVRQTSGRAPESTTIGETALQVVLHSLHHRAQINARLREIGGEPPLVDYIAWLWLGKPEGAWPAQTTAQASVVDEAPLANCD